MRLIIQNDSFAITNDPLLGGIVPPEGLTAETASEWAVRDGELVHIGPGTTPLERQLADLSRIRWEHQVAGTTFVAGDGTLYAIKTDEESLALIGGERQAAKDGIRSAGDVFKCARVTDDGLVIGSYPMTDADIIALSDAARAHIAACFNREGALANELIAAKTDEERAAIDLTTGWPGE